MEHKIDNVLINICMQIIHADKTESEWADVESDDMFNLGNYSGGFDATEMMFCFSLYLNENEYWFQFPLEEATKIAIGEKQTIEVRLAE